MQTFTNVAPGLPPFHRVATAIMTREGREAAMAAAEEHPRFASAVDLLLLHCLETCEAHLAGAAAAAETPRHDERVHLLNACVETMERDVERALARLFDLMRAFDVVPEVRWLQERIDSYVDRASAQVTDALSRGGSGGSPVTPAEQRQVLNVRSRSKSRSRAEVAREIEAVQERRKRRAVGEVAKDDLDDRLPLQRRGAFDRDLTALVSEARRDGTAVSLVMIDVDHFKKVNDEHGHPVGDEVLLELARRVAARVAHKGRAYRYGGEELALLLPGYSADEAAGLAERLRKDVAAAAMSRKAVAVTASFGVACVPEHAADPSAVLAGADAALYAAKRDGRDCVRVAG